jgi:hypothetical protein
MRSARNCQPSSRVWAAAALLPIPGSFEADPTSVRGRLPKMPTYFFSA